MVSLKQAVENAMTFATSVLGQERASDLRLEEVETDRLDGQPVWQITLSMLALQGPSASATLMSVLVSPPPREYKTFAVSQATGEVLKMKIRVLAAA
jgi:glycine cleavage system aminomethyltransferase T